MQKTKSDSYVVARSVLLKLGSTMMPSSPSVYKTNECGLLLCIRAASTLNFKITVIHGANMQTPVKCHNMAAYKAFLFGLFCPRMRVIVVFDFNQLL